MITFEYYGQPLSSERIAPGNTSTALSSNCYYYKEFDLAIDSGGTHELVAGDWIVGNTGAAKAQIVSVGTLSGATTWAGGDATCTLRIKSYSGTAFVNDEVLNHTIDNAATDTATVNGVAHAAPSGYDNEGMVAKCALIIAYTSPMLLCLDGGEADQLALNGVRMYASSTVDSSYPLKDINEIKKCRVANITHDGTGVINVIYYF